MVNEEAIKQAFDRVKEDIKDLKDEISQIKRDLEEVKSKIKFQKEVLKSEDLASPQEDFIPISTGNKGVANSQRQPTDDRPPTANDNRRQTPTIEITLSELKESLNSAFRSLTNREFSVFMALYELDKEKGGDITYYELAQRLNLSESTIRDFVNQLIRKKIPIEKYKEFNNKVSLSIKEEFRRLNLYQNLLKLRARRQGQRTLFDI